MCFPLGRPWRKAAVINRFSDLRSDVGKGPSRALRYLGDDFACRLPFGHQSNSLPGPHRQGLDIAFEVFPYRLGFVAADLVPERVGCKHLALAGALTVRRATGRLP